MWKWTFRIGMASDFTLVGMLYTAVGESRERIESALSVE
jgi:hypothetical protein